MRRTLIAYLALVLIGTVALQLPAARPASAQEEFQAFTPDELDNLVAPVALYPDPLLAQVLLAATFPDQLAEAAQYVRANGTAGLDMQPWDVSVRAVAHYPTVLNMMDTKADWTTALGQAYAAQSTDVTIAVQRMRGMARAQGNLVSTPQQQIVYNDGYISIWPANPRYVYVPVYDPGVIYMRPVWARPGLHLYFNFGVPLPIGAWLMYDWDWRARRIVYTGWNGGGWIARSRPFVQVRNVYYVHPKYQRVVFAREVVHRRPDYSRINRYEAIHRGVTYERHGPPGDRGVRRGPVDHQPGTPVRRGPVNDHGRGPSGGWNRGGNGGGNVRGNRGGNGGNGGWNRGGNGGGNGGGNAGGHRIGNGGNRGGNGGDRAHGGNRGGNGGNKGGDQGKGKGGDQGKGHGH